MATVLLVEDHPGARQGLELALRRLGYGVHAAETGEAALRDFHAAAADVVVLDVMLPGLDGAATPWTSWAAWRPGPTTTW